MGFVDVKLRALLRWVDLSKGAATLAAASAAAAARNVQVVPFNPAAAAQTAAAGLATALDTLAISGHSGHLWHNQSGTLSSTDVDFGRFWFFSVRLNVRCSLASCLAAVHEAGDCSGLPLVEPV